jgi:hypothetical protein
MGRPATPPGADFRLPGPGAARGYPKADFRGSRHRREASEGRSRVNHDAPGGRDGPSAHWAVQIERTGLLGPGNSLLAAFLPQELTNPEGGLLFVPR